MKAAEIITVGKEILTGRVLDTNTRYVARKLNFLGLPLIRVAIIDDDVETIAQELKRALSGKANIVFTLGGLGPTFDDVTLAGVAKAVDKKLVLDKAALEFIQGRYRTFLEQKSVDHDRMTPEREKMAWLPESSTIMDNPVGAAPGVILEFSSRTIFSLPGVPAEMEAMFEGSVEPRLAAMVGRSVMLEESLLSGYKDESALAPIVKAVMEKVPGVYIKSCADCFAPEVNLKIVISAAGREEKETRARLTEAVACLKQALSR